MKKLSAKLKKEASFVFENNKEIDTVYATTDGFIFLPSAKDFAKQHAQRNGLDIIPIQRKDLKEPEGGKSGEKEPNGGEPNGNKPEGGKSKEKESAKK